MEKKTLIIFAAIFVGFMGLMLYFSNQNKIDLNKYDLNKIISADKNTGEIKEHIFQNETKNQKAVLIEYGDYQCPSCATMSTKIKALAEEYKGKMTVIFRNFPLEGHPNALSAAAAAEAAGLQGKYDQMHSLLFEKQSEWSPATISERGNFYEKYAKEIGLDLEKFKEDMKSDSINKKIRFDKLTGKELKVNATPTLILNGQKLDSNTYGDDSKFREAIENAIK